MEAGLKPVTIADNYEPLKCMRCGKDLLDNRDGVFVHVEGSGGESPHYVSAYWACKGQCDNELQKDIFQGAKGDVAFPWENIVDLMNPLLYMRWDMATLNQSQRNAYSQEAFERLREFKLKLAQMVLREPTEDERAKFKEQQELREAGLL